MKQKVLISGLSLLLTFSLAGCGGQQAQQEPQEPKQEVQQSGAISTEPPAEVVPTATAVPSEADPAEEVADHEEDLTEEVQLFTDCNETVYATGTVNLRNGAGTSFEKVGSLNTGDSVTRTGIGTAEAEGWSRIQLSDGSIVYVSNKYISTTKPAPQQQQQQTSKPSGGTTTQQQQQTQQPSGDTSSLPGIDLPSGTPITGGSSSQAQQPSDYYIPPEQIGDRTNPDLIESATKGMGGDLSGGHIEPW